MLREKTALDLEVTLAQSVDVLELSQRASNWLRRRSLQTLRDLVHCTEEDLLDLTNFSETTLIEVNRKLQERGLRLGMKFNSGTLVFGDEP